MTEELIRERILVIGDGYRAKNSELSDAGLPFARAGNINNGFHFEKVDCIPTESIGKVGEKRSQSFDSVFTSKGSVGRIAFVKPETQEFVYSPQLCYWRSLAPNVLDARFLNYWMNGREFLNQVDYLKSQTDMADYVSLRDQRKMTFTIPSIKDQKKAATVLGALDDKIELNHQINQTLEQIAQVIFKSWFVDFEPVKAKQHIRTLGGNDERTERAAQAVIAGAVNLATITTATDLSTLNQQISQVLGEKLAHQTDAQREQLAATATHFPDQLAESELGLIPEGWSVDVASQISNVAIGKTPPRKEAEWFSKSCADTKWASIRDMGRSGVYLLKVSEYLTSPAVKKFNVRKIPDNTVLLSFKLTVGRVAITVGEMLSNEAIAHFTIGNDALVTTEYLYLYLKQFDYESLGSTSSIATAVNSKMIKNMLVLIPGASVINQFSKVVCPIFDNIKSNQLEVLSLTSARDTLLPMLLSGELTSADSLLALVKK